MAIIANKLEFLSLKEAASISPYSAVYLNSLVRRGKIKATKVGRDWLITKADLFNYVQKQLAESKSRILQLGKYVDGLNQ